MNTVNITGIVVCGGQSVRMGQDKSLLTYYNQPQRYYIAQLLQTFCREVYISLNATQEEHSANYNIIRDQAAFIDKGPMTALLSAYESLPNQNFLFIGCDYPLLSCGELARFVKSINEDTKVKTFFNTAANLYEPLLAYYAAGFLQDVMQCFRNGNSSLQKLLLCFNAEKYIPEDKNTLKSIDTKEEFKNIKNYINKC